MLNFKHLKSVSIAATISITTIVTNASAAYVADETGATVLHPSEIQMYSETQSAELGAATEETIKVAFSAPQPRPRLERSLTIVRDTSAPSNAALGVFGSVVLSASRLPDAARWREAVSNAKYDKYFSASCAGLQVTACDTRFARQLQSVSMQNDTLSDLRVLALVNRKVNEALEYRSDLENWGTGDLWATPEQISARGAGDCEDYAFAKMWMLRAAGFSADQLQMVILSDTRRQLFHAVLVAHVHGKAYVLDNLSDSLRQDIDIRNYLPIMSFVGERSFIHGFENRRTEYAALPTDLTGIMPGEGY